MQDKKTKHLRKEKFKEEIISTIAKFVNMSKSIVKDMLITEISKRNKTYENIINTENLKYHARIVLGINNTRECK